MSQERGKTTAGSNAGSFHPAATPPSQRASAPTPDDTANSNQCPHCSTTSRDLTSLLAHMRVAHPEQADQFEPSGMELTEYRGSWEAACDGLYSGTYATRETAIRGWHRSDRRREHERAVAAGMTLLDTAVAGVAGEIDGPISVGYIGNVDPSGRNDHRLWMIWAHGWCRPRGLYPTNPVSVTIGDTAEVAGMTGDKAARLAAALAADVRKGLADGSIHPRAHGRT